jgi:extradiol dioxygenase family protein
MPEADFQALKARIETSAFDYLDAPYRRFKGTEFEQETFFISDPNGNVVEMKTMVNPEVLFG